MRETSKIRFFDLVGVECGSLLVFPSIKSMGQRRQGPSNVG